MKTYENKHLNSDLLACNFTNLSEDQFYDSLKKANQKLMKNYFTSQMVSTLESIEYLYDEKDVTFRGFRHSGVNGPVGKNATKAQIKCEHNHQGPEVNWESSVTTDGDIFKSNKIYNSKKYIPKPPKYDFDKFYSRLISRKEFKNQLNFLDN